jgi:hypothetical protein
VSDSIEFNFVPYGDENGAEALFRDYLEELISHIDVASVRSSCARERALLKVVCGAYDVSWNNIHAEPFRLRDVFARLALAFGWFGEEAELLAMWLGVYPNCDDCTTKPEWESRLQEAMEALHSDPYFRHEMFWKRCVDQGVDSFMCFWDRQADPFMSAVTLIEEAAKAMGDE